MPIVPVYTVDASQVIAEHVAARHGVDHDFKRDGWNGFTKVVITSDGVQVFTESVSATGRGRVTGAAAPGNHRVAHLRDGTVERDSVITSVIYGPGSGWGGTNAQQGHLHRVREISPGLWEGIAIWTS